MRLRITKGANREIAAVALSLRRHSQVAAQRFTKGLDKALETLRQFPESGLDRSDLLAGFRMTVLQPYGHVLFYSLINGEIVVGHLFDGRRDLKATLRDD